MIKNFNLKPNQKNIDIAIDELQNNKNNAISHVYNNAKVSNQGQLAGVPITVKNLFATKDAPTDASSNLLLGFLPGYDAHIITLLKNEGASIVAKTNLDELALGGTGLYSSYGVIKNPLDSTRIVGGSSSGSAATFTKNIGASIGSDTGDSIRMPASFVGAIGYKPSYGVISRRGMFPYASSLDTVGYLTHNVHDAAIVSSVLFDLDKEDATSRKVKFDIKNIGIKKPKKVSYITLGDSEKFIDNSMNNLIKKLVKNNVEITKINIEKKILDSLPIVYKIISFSEAASNNSNLSGLLFGNTIEGDD
jgi:aspartyl-tRNA(Asn)/glutamyl-tRNA(Gln) amidotransferase subunit A